MIKQRINAVIETLNRKEIFQVVFLYLAITSILLAIFQHHFLHTFNPQLTLIVLTIVGAVGYITASKNKRTAKELTSYAANKLFAYFFSHKQEQTVQYQHIYQDMLQFRNEAKAILNQECFFDNEFEYVAHLPFAKSFPFTTFICLYVDKENIPFDELIRLDIDNAA